MNVVASLAKSVLLEAVRNRLLWLTGIAIAAAFGLAQFLQQVAIAESREIQAAVLAAALRVSTVFIAAAFVITSMARESSDRVTELLLSLPAPRTAYFAGKFSGYALVAAILASLAALPLAPFCDPGALAVWTVSLFCELLIVTAVSLLCALTLPQTVPAFAAVAGFYLLSRSMAAMQVIAGASLQSPSATDRAVNAIVDSIALLLPALDRMTQAGWLTGPSPGWGTLGPVLAQTIVYLILIGAAALFDLHRKNL